jgi:membrane protein
VERDHPGGLSDTPLERGPTGWRSLTRRPAALGRKAAQVIPEAADGFFRDHCTQHAAGIAYRVLFSIAPLAIALVAIAGLVLRDDDRRAAVIDAIVELVPTSGGSQDNVEAAVTGIATPTSAIGLFSVVAFAWTASGMMRALRIGLEAAMHVTTARSAVRAKLVDLALVVASGSLVIIVMVASTLGQLARSGLENLLDRLGLESSWIPGDAVRLVPLAISVLAVLLLFRYVPARSVSFGDRLAGALVTGILLTALSLASSFIYDRTTSLSLIFGSLTTLFVFLYSVYLYACALLFGAEVAATWSRPLPDADQPLHVALTRMVWRLIGRPRPSRGSEQEPHRATGTGG